MKNIVLIIVQLVFSLFLLAQGPFAWSELSPMPIKVSNNAVSEGYVGGVPYVYSFGGIDSTKHHDGITQNSFRMNAATGVWEQIPDLPDTLGKIASSANRVGDTIYIVGGYHVLSDGSEISSEKIHRYVPSTNSYISDGAPLPKAIDDQVQVVWRDSLLFVITGWSNTGNMGDVQIYNPRNDSWQNGTPVPTTNSLYRVFGSAGSIIGDTIYYYGGAKSGFNFPASDLLRKGVINPNDPTDITWSPVSFGPEKKYRPAAFTHDGKVFWVGGSEISYNYDGLAYFDGSGVEPGPHYFSYDPKINDYRSFLSPYETMDLRGVAKIAPDTWVLCGGMKGNQEVTDRVLQLKVNPTFVGVDESNKLKIELFPNPCRDILRLKSNYEALIDWEIVHIDGSRILTGKGLNISTVALAPGMYMLRVRNRYEKKTMRFVKS